MKVCHKCGCCKIVIKTETRTKTTHKTDHIGNVVDMAGNTIDAAGNFLIKGVVFGGALLAVEAMSEMLGVRAKGKGKLVKEIFTVSNKPKKNNTIAIEKKYNVKVERCSNCGLIWSLDDQYSLLEKLRVSGIIINLNSETGRKKYVKSVNILEKKIETNNEIEKQIEEIIDCIHEKMITKIRNRYDRSLIIGGSVIFLSIFMFIIILIKFGTLESIKTIIFGISATTAFYYFEKGALSTKLNTILAIKENKEKIINDISLEIENYQSTEIDRETIKESIKTTISGYSRITDSELKIDNIIDGLVENIKKLKDLKKDFLELI